MASRKEQKERLRQERLEREDQEQKAKRKRTFRLRIAAIVGMAVVALAVVFVSSRKESPSPAKSEGTGKAGLYNFEVGAPGPGEKAPPIELPATDGETFDLAELKGKNVLLYFQEGLGCQPCWDQMKDIEAKMSSFKKLGIEEVVNITSDPLDQLQQKNEDEGLKTPVVSDIDLAVSGVYTTDQYGMMGHNRNGHSFILVGPDGKIRYRADYGGAPDYTMYVPVPNLIADIKKELDERG